MKRVFETVECDEVRNYTFLVQRYKKHQNQVKVCAVELKVSNCCIAEMKDCPRSYDQSRTQCSGC